MKLIKKVTWGEIQEKIIEIFGEDRSQYPKSYGVPRGGCAISAMINPVDSPDEAEVIVDDLIDSGKTRDRYKERFPDKPFIDLFPKDPDHWLEFPWEIHDTPGEDNFTRILQVIGEDPSREGLKDTPRRYLKFLAEFLNPEPFNYTTFDSEKFDEMIVQTGIPFYSLCEHHIAPFFGEGHIAYIPENGKIVGISKLARCLEKYARRLQNQERITTQIAEELQRELGTDSVAVVLKAQHLCMSMRGIKKHDTHTITSKLTGKFREGKPRTEFLALIDLGGK